MYPALYGLREVRETYYKGGMNRDIFDSYGGYAAGTR
jgi:hypothetical protein